MTLLLVPNDLLVPFISIASLVCLGMVIGKVHARKIANDRKIASALAQAVRGHQV